MRGLLEVIGRRGLEGGPEWVPKGVSKGVRKICRRGCGRSCGCIKGRGGPERGYKGASSRVIRGFEEVLKGP